MLPAHPFGQAAASLAAARAATARSASLAASGGLSGWGTMAAANMTNPGAEGPLSASQLQAAVAAAQAQLNRIPQYTQQAIAVHPRLPAAQAGQPGDYAGNQHWPAKPLRSGTVAGHYLPLGRLLHERPDDQRQPAVLFRQRAINAFGGMGYGNPFSGQRRFRQYVRRGVVAAARHQTQATSTQLRIGEHHELHRGAVTEVSEASGGRRSACGLSRTGSRP